MMGLLVVVNVTLRRRVRSLGSLECNTNKVLTKDVVEDAGTEVAVLLELMDSQYLCCVYPPRKYVRTISLMTSQA